MARAAKTPPAAPVIVDLDTPLGQSDLPGARTLGRVGGRLHLELFAAPGLAQEALDELEQELREALELPPRS